MAYIGKVPTAVPLSTNDLADSIVTSAKITDGTISLADLSATGTKDATTFLRGDNTFAEAGGGVNTPAFYTTRSGTQSIPHATETKVQLNTVDIDTASGFDNTTNYRYTVPSGQGGKYLITAHAMFGESISLPHTTLKKNGTRIGANKQNSDYSGGSVVIIETLSEGDYLELFTFQYSGGSADLQSAEDYTYLGAFKIIE